MTRFHEGERAIQERAGTRDLAEKMSKMIESAIIEPAVDFLAERTLIAIAWERDGVIRCDVWIGPPGFASATPDGTRVRVVRDAELAIGTRVGMLAIDPPTRRRWRINGVVDRVEGGAIEVAVEESFPNCTKYIVRRAAPAMATGEGVAVHGAALDADRRALIARVDMMFVGTVHATRGADASHRGGEPGFVRVIDDHTLEIPDYSGNGMFQTLGNLAVDPRVGAVLVDVAGRKKLVVTGRATIAADLRAWRIALSDWAALPLG